MPEIILENSGWWLLPIALLSLIAAWLLYFKGRSFSLGQRRLLFVLRFLIFFLLGFLLLSPLLRMTEREEEKPILVWLEDHSRSMLLHDDSAEVRDVLVSGDDVREGLEDRYRIEQFDFADELMAASDSFSAAGTNLDRVFSQVRERFYNRNVGALVLLSDGIYNRGSNPSYVVQALPYPVYAVGFGDTAIPRDLFIGRVVHNDVSYTDNEFPVEVYLRAREMAGEDYSLRVTDPEGSVVHRQSIDIENDDHFQRSDFFLKAESPGLRRYRVEVESGAEEENLSNNVAYFTIEVVDNRKQVAIFASGPHPDMAAISAALENVERYEVNTYIEASMPATLTADLVILHNPSADLLQEHINNETPFWLIQGPQTPVGLMGDLTPVQTAGKGFEEVNGIISGDFDLFKIAEEEREWTKELPPLWGPFGRAEIDERARPLFYKKIGNVETEDPLWFFVSRQRDEQSTQKQAYTLGTGLWRWRINDYREHRSHERFDGLISKTVQYLTTQPRRDRFNVDMAPRFDRAEALLAEARLFNASMELTNEPEVDITFTDEDGDVYQFSFSRAQSTYRLNAGRLPAGVYTWRASTALGDESFEERGSVVIEESHIEETDLVARHDLLRKITSESGGQFFQKGEWEQLNEALMNNTEAKTIQVLQTSTGSIIDKRWIFAIFLILLAMEWGLRKYFGNY